MIDSVSETAGAAADLKKARRQKNAAQRTPTIDRLPPHDLDMEQGVLGCALLSPNECVGECIEKLKDGGQEVFYDLRHQTIYEMLATMFNERMPIDVITVQQRLKDKQLLEQVGGIAYLAQLAGCRAERGEFELLSRHRAGKIPAAENDCHLHGRRRAGL